MDIIPYNTFGQDDLSLNRFGCITVELRQMDKDRNTAVERLKKLKDDDFAVINLNPSVEIGLADGDKPWSWPKEALVENYWHKLWLYSDYLREWAELLKPYMDKIKYVISESEFGRVWRPEGTDFECWDNPARITAINKAMASIIKHYFPMTLIMYARGYHHTGRQEPFWNGLSVEDAEEVDCLTPSLYDCVHYKYDSQTLMINAVKAAVFDIPIIPFIGVMYETSKPVGYYSEVDLVRGLHLRHYKEFIPAIVLYPTPDFNDESWNKHLDKLQEGIG